MVVVVIIIIITRLIEIRATTDVRYTNYFLNKNMHVSIIRILNAQKTSPLANYQVVQNTLWTGISVKSGFIIVGHINCGFA